MAKKTVPFLAHLEPEQKAWLEWAVEHTQFESQGQAIRALINSAMAAQGNAFVASRSLDGFGAVVGASTEQPAKEGATA